jgi:hypothetical protein
MAGLEKVFGRRIFCQDLVSGWQSSENFFASNTVCHPGPINYTKEQANEEQIGKR